MDLSILKKLGRVKISVIVYGVPVSGYVCEEVELASEEAATKLLAIARTIENKLAADLHIIKPGTTWQEGFDAFHSGSSIEENPHSAGVPSDRMHWRKGFDTAAIGSRAEAGPYGSGQGESITRDTFKTHESNPNIIKKDSS